MKEEPPVSYRDQSRYMLRFVLRYLLSKWFWIAGVGILGTLIGVWIAMSPHRSYRAEASFLLSREIADQQEIRFGSRDLILEAAQRLEFGQIQYFTRFGFWGKKEIYRQSPVEVELEFIPEHLLDKEMKIEFLPKARIVLEIEDFKGNVNRVEGHLGKRIKLGDIGLILHPTIFYGDFWIDKSIYFSVPSESELVHQFHSGIDIRRFTIHPNKITVRYSDVNHLRAKEYLQVFTDVLLKDSERHNIPQAQLKLVDSQIGDLLGKLRESLVREGKSLYGPENVFASSDTLFPTLDSLQLETSVLHRRIELLEAAKRLSFPFADHFSDFALNAEDLALSDLSKRLLQLQEDSSGNKFEEIQQIESNFKLLREKLEANDQKRLERVSSKIREVQAIFTLGLLRRKSFLVPGSRNSESELSYLWEQLFQLIEKREELYLEIASSHSKISLLEAPHELPYLGRTHKLRTIAQGGLAGTVLMIILFVFHCIGTDRIYMQEQLGVEFPLPTLALGKQKMNNLKATEFRKSFVFVEIRRKKEDRYWVFGSEEDSDLPGNFCKEMAGRQSEHGKSVLLIQVKEGNFNQLDPVIPDSQAGETTTLLLESDALTLGQWLISSQSERLVRTALQQFDFVFLNFPSLEQLPEVIPLIRQSDVLIWFLIKGQSRRSKLRNWLGLLPKNKPKQFLVLVN